ncbi:hypothetical protein AB205_0109600, partial [Aquarana catesbeiana]
MSKRVYNSEEAFQILSMTDESNGEFSSDSNSNSDSKSNSAFEPIKSSNDSDEEWVPPKSARHSGNQAATRNQYYIPRPSISAAASNRPQEQRPNTSAAASNRPRKQIPRPTQEVQLPQLLECHIPQEPGPLHTCQMVLPTQHGTNYSPFHSTARCAGQHPKFTEIDCFHLFLPATSLQFIVNQTNLYAQQYIANNPRSSYAHLFEWRYLNLE